MRKNRFLRDCSLLALIAVIFYACSTGTEFIDPGGIGTNPYKPTPCRLIESDGDSNIYNATGTLIQRIVRYSEIYTYHYVGDSIKIYYSEEDKGIQNRIHAAYKVGAGGEPLAFLEYRYYDWVSGPKTFRWLTRYNYENGLLAYIVTTYESIADFDSTRMHYDAAGKNIIAIDYYNYFETGDTHSNGSVNYTYDNKFNPNYGLLYERPNLSAEAFSKNNITFYTVLPESGTELPKTYPRVYTYNKRGLPTTMKRGPRGQGMSFLYHNCN